MPFCQCVTTAKKSNSVVPSNKNPVLPLQCKHHHPRRVVLGIVDDGVFGTGSRNLGLTLVGMISEFLLYCDRGLTCATRCWTIFFDSFFCCCSSNLRAMMLGCSVSFHCPVCLRICISSAILSSLVEVKSGIFDSRYLIFHLSMASQKRVMLLNLSC